MEPFLKWAGGKRWLISQQAGFFPEKSAVERYIEPFLGGGAIFFYLKPTKGFLSDINPSLVNAYNVIKNNWIELYQILEQYHQAHSKDFYYNIRSSKPETPMLDAARFIYLNRTCWNGLYRVNKKGEFNVPIGTKTKVISNTDNFAQLSTVLNRMVIEVSDFEDTINRSGPGDFVFIDPPYTVKHNLNGFLKYNENIFSWEDQIRLKNSVLQAKNRGAAVLVLNANHSSVRELYSGVGDMTALNRASVIAGKSNARGIYSELVIKCW